MAGSACTQGYQSHTSVESVSGWEGSPAEKTALLPQLAILVQPLELVSVYLLVCVLLQDHITQEPSAC